MDFKLLTWHSQLLTWHSLISIQYTPFWILGNFCCCIYSKDLDELSNLQWFQIISNYTRKLKLSLSVMSNSLRPRGL